MANTTRSRLLRVATKEFAEHGYDSTTIDTIAEKLGVTGGALYRYVPSKQDLFCRCLDQCDVIHQKKVFDQVRRAQGPQEKFRALFGSLTRLALEEPQILVLLGQPRRQLSLKKRRYYGEKDKEAIKFMQDVLADFVAEESLDKSISPLLALYIMQGMIIWVTRWYTPHADGDIDRLTDEMMHLFLNGLTGPRRNYDVEPARFDFTRRHLVTATRPSSSRRVETETTEL